MSPTHIQFGAGGPGQPTTDQRLDEVAGLLAAGILRLHLRRLQAGPVEPQKLLENQLDAGARRSVHASRT